MKRGCIKPYPIAAMPIGNIAITRAKVACYLMEGSQRYNGKGILKSAKPSPFYDLPGVKKRRCDVKW